jgi:hypothetical protein
MRKHRYYVFNLLLLVLSAGWLLQTHHSASYRARTSGCYRHDSEPLPTSTRTLEPSPC